MTALASTALGSLLPSLGNALGSVLGNLTSRNASAGALASSSAINAAELGRLLQFQADTAFNADRDSREMHEINMQQMDRSTFESILKVSHDMTMHTFTKQMEKINQDSQQMSQSAG